MVGEAVEQSGGELLVTGEDLDPLGEGQVGRDHHALPLVTLGKEVEEQFASGTVKRYEAQLVDDEQVNRLQSPVKASELSGVTSLDESAHDVCRTTEEHATPLPDCFDAQRNCQVSFSCGRSR